MNRAQFETYLLKEGFTKNKPQCNCNLRFVKTFDNGQVYVYRHHNQTWHFDEEGNADQYRYTQFLRKDRKENLAMEIMVFSPTLPNERLHLARFYKGKVPSIHRIGKPKTVQDFEELIKDMK